MAWGTQARMRRSLGGQTATQGIGSGPGRRAPGEAVQASGLCR